LSELNLQRHLQVTYECIIYNFVLRSSYVIRYQCVRHRRSASWSGMSKAVRSAKGWPTPIISSLFVHNWHAWVRWKLVREKLRHIFVFTAGTETFVT